MKIASKFIKKILTDNGVIAELSNAIDRSLSRTVAIINENKKNGHLTTEAALRIICDHTGATREEILEETK